MSDETKHDSAVFDEAATALVELGNKILDREGDEMMWAAASGLLAGAVQFWLYSRQPCEDPDCTDCDAIATSDLRQEELLEEVMQFAVSSEYFHSPNDRDVGKA